MGKITHTLTVEGIRKSVRDLKQQGIFSRVRQLCKAQLYASLYGSGLVVKDRSTRYLRIYETIGGSKPDANNVHELRTRTLLIAKWCGDQSEPTTEIVTRDGGVRTRGAMPSVEDLIQPVLSTDDHSRYDFVSSKQYHRYRARMRRKGRVG